MEVEHLGIVHLVYMVAGEYQDIWGVLFFYDIYVLENSVCGTLIPAFVDPLLGRDSEYVLIEFRVQQVLPPQSEVPVKGEGLILCNNYNPADVGINAVGKGKI